MAECNRVGECGFFRKWQGAEVQVCDGFIRMYCHGKKAEKCKRCSYEKTHRKAPSDDMLPNGVIYSPAPELKA